MTDTQKAQIDPLNSLLTRQIPDKLWHYTSVQGFQAIITNKTIWATDTRFLNDREEFIHVHKIADLVVQETPEFGTNGFPARDFFNKALNLSFNTGVLHPSRLQIFVASFSAAEDQLSQWRGYSGGSSGVSLAFDLSALRPPSDIGTLVSFAPCVYDLEEKKTLLRGALRHFMTEVEGYWKAPLEAAKQWDFSVPIDKTTLATKISSLFPEAPELFRRLHTAVVKTSADLLRVAALSKNQSFHEEQEWRLVLPIQTGKEGLNNPPHFRAGSTALIPYIAYSLPQGSNATVPLVDVILGPGSHTNAIPSAMFFLKSQGIRVIPRESSVPYRPW